MFSKSEHFSVGLEKVIEEKFSRFFQDFLIIDR